MAIFNILEEANTGSYGAKITEFSAVRGGRQFRVSLTPFDKDTGKEFATITDWID